MIQKFAQISPTEFVTIISVIAGMLVGFYALIKFMLLNQTKTQEKDRLERLALAKAIERMAKATETTASEAEKRNGHLAELIIESKEGTIKAIHCIKVNQKVKEQHVDSQVVEHETLKVKE